MLRNLSFKVTSKSVIHYVKLSIKWKWPARQGSFREHTSNSAHFKCL
jgi:hypothetical protein